MSTSDATNLPEIPPFSELVEERLAEHKTPRSVAESIWEEYGATLFDLLPDEWVVGVLTEAVRRIVGRDRSQAVHVEYAESGRNTDTGIPAGACRMVLREDYWAKRWLVDGQWRQTRELRPADLEWLVASYAKVASEANAHAEFLEHCLALAKKHGVKKLGELEKRGVSLDQEGE